MSMITLDGDGRVVQVDAGELSRVGLSGWQVRGRDFRRELAWTVGADAATRIGAFLHGDQPVESLHSEVSTRTGLHHLDLTLIRGDDGGVTVVVEPAPAQ